jgi:hypothetical protein
MPAAHRVVPGAHHGITISDATVYRTLPVGGARIARDHGRHTTIWPITPITIRCEDIDVFSSLSPRPAGVSKRLFRPCERHKGDRKRLGFSLLLSTR